MKKNIIHPEWRLAIVFVILATLMAGCGSGSGSLLSAGVGTGGTGGLAKPVSGTVADGYLSKAFVFMDKHGNYQWDGVEPSATTDANGAYTLNIDPADVGKYPIVAMAIKGVTVDTENNPTMTPLTSSYVLSMPAAAVSGTASSNFVSPMSSLVRELMETQKYGTEQNSTTMQNAMSALGQQLGLSGTVMLTDYITTSNTTMHTAAQNMATLMGSQMDQIISTSGAINVDRYRAMMGTIFATMPSMMGSNGQAAMAGLIGTMNTAMSNVPATSAGVPFKNMSAAFRGGMMGR
jgi:hypothetical protein